MKLFNSAIVLAGGKSRRMGYDKAFIKIGDITCIELIINKLRKYFDEIIITTSSGKHKFDIPNAKIVIDEFKDLGPIAGLHAGLKESTSLYNYLIACDMPIICGKLISYMKQKLKSKPDIIACKRSNFIEPFHAVYSKKLINKIEKQIKANQFSIYSLMKKSNLYLIDDKVFNTRCKGLSIWTNLNTQNELVNFIWRERECKCIRVGRNEKQRSY